MAKNDRSAQEAIIVGIIQMASVAAHCWTTFLAFRISGWIAGLITFLAPTAAEVYWAVAYSYKTGTVLNSLVAIYIVVLLVYVACYIALAMVSERHS